MVMCYRLKLWDVLLGSKANESETSADFDAARKRPRTSPSAGSKWEQEEALYQKMTGREGQISRFLIMYLSRTSQVITEELQAAQDEAERVRKRSRRPHHRQSCGRKAKKDGIDDCLPSLSQSKQHNHSQRERQPIIIRHDFHIPLHRCSNEPPCASRTAKYQRYRRRRRCRTICRNRA